MVSSTRFQHRRRHLGNWFSNDGHTRNQIDHILVRSRQARSLLDCRASRGADTGSASYTDHALVRASVPLRLKKLQRTRRAPRINASRLKMAAGDLFYLELHNRCSHLLGLAPEKQLEYEWKELKSSFFEAAAANLGHSRCRRGDWITGPTLELADRMQQARMSGDPEHTNLRRRLTRSLRADRNAHCQ